MKFKLIVMVACFCLIAVARADVVLILNGASYQAPKTIEYFFATGVLEVNFEEGMACDGESDSQPGDALMVSFGNQSYTLQGEVVLDFSADPVLLLMSSDSGTLTCQFDRVFKDRFAML